MSPSIIRSSVVPSTSPADFEVRRTRTYAVSTLWQQRTLPTHMAIGWALVCLALVSAVSPAHGQMDPAEIQRQLLEEMGGEFLGGSGSAPPNRIGIFDVRNRCQTKSRSISGRSFGREGRRLDIVLGSRIEVYHLAHFQSLNKTQQGAKVALHFQKISKKIKNTFAVLVMLQTRVV